MTRYAETFMFPCYTVGGSEEKVTGEQLLGIQNENVVVEMWYQVEIQQVGRTGTLQDW